MTITTTPLGLFGSTALYHCALCAGKECYQHSSGQHQRAVPLSPTFLGALLKPRLRTLCAVFALLSQPMCPCCIYCHVYRLCVDIIALLWCIQIWQLHTTHTHTKDRYRAGGCHTLCVCVSQLQPSHSEKQCITHSTVIVYVYIYSRPLYWCHSLLNEEAEFDSTRGVSSSPSSVNWLGSYPGSPSPPLGLQLSLACQHVPTTHTHT